MDYSIQQKLKIEEQWNATIAEGNLPGFSFKTSEDNCVICTEKINEKVVEGIENHRGVQLQCGHIFGSSCLQVWLLEYKKNTCPYCRSKPPRTHELLQLRKAYNCIAGAREYDVDDEDDEDNEYDYFDEFDEFDEFDDNEENEEYDEYQEREVAFFRRPTEGEMTFERRATEGELKAMIENTPWVQSQYYAKWRMANTDEERLRVEAEAQAVLARRNLRCAHLWDICQRQAWPEYMWTDRQAEQARQARLAAQSS